MSTYSSAFTGYAPGGFHRDNETRFIDVATSIHHPGEIRFILTEDCDPTRPLKLEDEHTFTPAEARETAIRLLMCADTPHDLIKPLLALQEADPDAPLDPYL